MCTCIYHYDLMWWQKAMMRVVNNAYKQYCKSRPAPSSESLKRSKSFSSISIGFHPIFCMFCLALFISIYECHYWHRRSGIKGAMCLCVRSSVVDERMNPRHWLMSEICVSLVVGWQEQNPVCTETYAIYPQRFFTRITGQMRPSLLGSPKKAIEMEVDMSFC